MSARILKHNNLAEACGYSKDKLRGLLDELPQFANIETKARVAKEYSRHDLLVIATCCRLEARYGLRRSTVAELSIELANALRGPRPVSNKAKLVITFDPLNVVYAEELTELVDGLVVALEPVFRQVDDYLLPDRSTAWPQQELALGPSALIAASSLQSREAIVEIGATPEISRSRKGRV
jgi:hypothetical protein